MKLQIRGCRPLELSQKASELQRLFSEVSDDQALADHLSETYVDDFYEVSLLYHSYALQAVACFRLTVGLCVYAPHVIHCVGGGFELLDLDTRAHRRYPHSSGCRDIYLRLLDWSADTR